MNSRYFLGLFTFLTFVATSQNWEWVSTTGGQHYDNGSNIGVDNAGNTYISGYSSYPCSHCQSYYQEMLFKFDNTGKLVWKDIIPFYQSKSVTDGNGNTYVTSGSRIAKYNNNGQEEWSVEGGNSGYNNIAFYLNSGIVVSGWDRNSSQAVSVVSRYDLNGNLIWTKVTSMPAGGSRPNIVVADKSGNIFLAGGWEEASPINKGQLMKLNAAGKIISTVNIPNNPLKLKFDQNNNLYILGEWGGKIEIQGTVYPESYGSNFLIKYDTETNSVMWHKIFTGPILTAYGLDINSRNEAIVAGNFTHWVKVDGIQLTGNYSVFVMKFGSEGELNWHMQNTKQQGVAGNPYTSNVNDIIADKNNDIYITGSFYGKGLFGTNYVEVNQPSDYYYDLMVAKVKDENTTVAIKENISKGAAFEIYPNPSGSVFNVQYKAANAQEHLSLRVVNVLGSTVYSEKIKDNSCDFTKALDLRSQAKGTYFISIESSEGTTTKKVIVE